jgi:hypothetical protein
MADDTVADDTVAGEVVVGEVVAGGDRLSTIHGVPVLVLPTVGELIGTERQAVDLIADAHGRGAELLVLPAERLAGEFFQLRTGVAGAIVQKFVTYQLRLAILGDVSRYVTRSETFASFVAETNRGRQLWFVADAEDLAARLAAKR